MYTSKSTYRTASESCRNIGEFKARGCILREVNCNVSFTAIIFSCKNSPYILTTPHVYWVKYGFYPIMSLSGNYNSAITSFPEFWRIEWIKEKVDYKPNTMIAIIHITFISLEEWDNIS